jgi:hypothetical protein
MLRTTLCLSVVVGAALVAVDGGHQNKALGDAGTTASSPQYLDVRFDGGRCDLRIRQIRGGCLVVGDMTSWKVIERYLDGGQVIAVDQAGVSVDGLCGTAIAACGVTIRCDCDGGSR